MKGLSGSTRRERRTILRRAYVVFAAQCMKRASFADRDFDRALETKHVPKQVRTTAKPHATPTKRRASIRPERLSQEKQRESMRE